MGESTKPPASAGPDEARLPAEAVEEMRAHALECFPDECCGVLIGSADGAVEVRRIRNIQDQMHARDPERYPRTARTAYVGDPDDLRDALESADKPGRKLMAFYHSHPDHDAYFSEEDVAQATPFGEPSYPDALQIVISVYGTSVKEIKGFAWSGEDEAFREVRL